MSKGSYVLAIDQGTTSTRAILFDEGGKATATAQVPLTQIYPAPGQVEHDADEIWRAVLQVCREVLAEAGAGNIAAVGITNQRETTVVWERATGKPLANAIVWQDRRTAPLCAALEREGWGAHVAETTGLVIDPYFSATKLAWLLANVPSLAERAASGEVCFGTIDSFLLFKLTAGRLHATDATNAARTKLFDIRSGTWDARLMDRLGVPLVMLPEVRDSQGDFGLVAEEHFGAALPIRGVAGDQQAAAYGQACFAPGMLKATYGTGCFVVANTGAEKVASATRMLSTILHQREGRRTYALEGAIFMAGATIQWLRDSLGVIATAAESEALAERADPKSGVYLVPAFQGLGAPFWDAGAKAAIVGLSRAASKADIVAAGLEAVAFQTRDLLTAMRQDMAVSGIAAAHALRVDGGMTANAWAMQRLADILGETVEVAATPETTALGAAYHAGQAVGFYGHDAALARAWAPSRVYAPKMTEAEREARYDGWLEAVSRVRSEAAP
ncbi:MAG: glycerol kinase GlpK [Methyloceanibacter sp.]|uniref:glycerol kinase GlpK n=1 Tax=Methyloceanibacter sp. TaxID=1965321 RepID=UPI003D6CE875